MLNEKPNYEFFCFLEIFENKLKTAKQIKPLNIVPPNNLIVILWHSDLEGQ